MRAAAGPTVFDIVKRNCAAPRVVTLRLEGKICGRVIAFFAGALCERGRSGRDGVAVDGPGLLSVHDGFAGSSARRAFGGCLGTERR